MFIVLSGCIGQERKPTLTETPSPSPVVSTPTFTPIPAPNQTETPTPTATPTPTSTQRPSLTPTPSFTCEETWNGNKTGIVDEVIDGDTLIVNSCKIRLALVDTPEAGEPGYSEAKQFTLNLCPVGSLVIVDQDNGQPRDIHGRIVAVIYAKGKCLNAELLFNGFARVLKEFCGVSEFSGEKWAQRYGCKPQLTPTPTLTPTVTMGPTPSPISTPTPIVLPSNCIVISLFHYDAAGNDNRNLNDEYVVFMNTCPRSIDMTGWKVTDEGAKHIYIFPRFKLNGGAKVYLHSGQGTNNNLHLYWGRSYGAIWNNDGDTLYLYDANGNLVLKKSY